MATDDRFKRLYWKTLKKNRRLEFSKKHKDWTVDDWKNVIRFDELCFQLHHINDNLVPLHFKYDQARRRFVEWAQNEIAIVPDFHKRILFSDEAHFWLNGYVNKQNCRIWSEANPQVYVETPLHPEKLTVCVIADQVHPFILIKYPVTDGYFQKDNALCHPLRPNPHDHAASVCLSHRHLPPVRITSLELLLSPRQLCRSACRRETLLGGGISENHSEPKLDCTVGVSSLGTQRAHNLRNFNFSETTLCKVVLLPFRNSNAKVEIVNRRSSRIFSSTALTKSSVITDGRPRNAVHHEHFPVRP
ncbi:hypothetical protein TNCV_4443171 [Trichonephila clavipes]|nr:hypothetical protein TNCV_4443171 [Trichonephila clavipes]